MGQRKTFECDSCGYEVLVSGGKDRGFIAYTNTYVCKDCNSLIDLTAKAVDIYDENNSKRDDCYIDNSDQNKVELKGIINQEEESIKQSNDDPVENTEELINSLPEEDHDFLRQVFGISNCNHRNVEIWDSIIKPCPRCNGKMKQSNRGGYVMWD